MKLEKISTEDLIFELQKRNNIKSIDVFEDAGYKIKLPFNKIVRGKGAATILVIGGVDNGQGGV